MTLFGCYFIALIPLIAASLLWYFNRKMVWFESLILAASGFLISTIFYFAATHSMYDDVETWSGQVVDAVHVPRWQEYYEEAVYRTEYYTEEEEETDSKGHVHTVTVTKSREVFDHWEPETRWHNDSWSAQDTLVSEYNIDVNRFEDIHKKFGGLVAVKGQRYTMEHASRMIAGDPNDYHVQNVNKYIYPVTTTKHWENRVKACPSVFSYAKVPPSVPVFDYPQNEDHFVSNRLLGPVGINLEKWDQLNAVLGSAKKVNLIMCAFGVDADSSMGQYQESKWIGGKKNDIVITFGGGKNNATPSWVYVFGWSESDLAKRNIESIILEHGINDSILPLIQQEVIKNYTIKNWHKFDYLRAEIPFSKYIWLIILTFGIGGGWVTFSLMNGIDKEREEDMLSFDGIHERARRGR